MNSFTKNQTWYQKWKPKKNGLPTESGGGFLDTKEHFFQLVVEYILLVYMFWVGDQNLRDKNFFFDAGGANFFGSRTRPPSPKLDQLFGLLSSISYSSVSSRFISTSLKGFQIFTVQSTVLFIYLHSTIRST